MKVMTIEEYVECLIRPIVKNNKSTESIIRDFGLIKDSKVSRSKCELCGAPHAVMFQDELVKLVKFFYSGTNQLSEKDNNYIEQFKYNFLHR